MSIVTRIATLGLALAALLAGASPRAAAAPGQPGLVLGGLDPVALSEGREEPGVSAASVVSGRYIYRFSSPEHRRTFLADPLRWGVQYGGACAKIRVLGGQGSPTRWHVHEGRLYLFASDICRDRFRADPKAFLDHADAPAAPTPREAAAARTVLDRAARAYGPAFDRLRTLELAHSADYTNRDSSVSTARRLAQWAFPDRYREHEEWPTLTHGHASDARGSFQFDGPVEWRHDADVRRIVERRKWREPLLLVRARRDRAFVARWAAREELAGELADVVEVSVHGATTVLAVGTASGRVLEARFRAPTNTGQRPIVLRYSEFREHEGLTLPHVIDQVVDGKVTRSPRLRLEAVRPDVALPAGRFKPGS